MKRSSALAVLVLVSGFFACGGKTPLDALGEAAGERDPGGTAGGSCVRRYGCPP